MSSSQPLAQQRVDTLPRDVSSPRVTVIVPAYCEELFIEKTLRAVPAFVSEIIVVDDASPDRTSEVARAVQDPRIQILRHASNRGVGAAIYTGYRQALLGQGDVFVVMAGDNQMDQADLPLVLAPLWQGTADYVKGNRLLHPEADKMPPMRRLGSRFFARMTSWVSGVRLHDTQCGYTAISRHAAARLPFDQMWRRYGYPNDLVITLLRGGARVVEVPVRPVYAGEKSGLRPWHFFSISYVIARRMLLEMRRSHREDAVLLAES